MKFKDTKYGDLSLKKIFSNSINVNFLQLTSLEGLPEEISGNLYIRINLLTSLDFCSHTVLGNFDCSDNQLETLKGLPKKVGENFYYGSNKLESLKCRPKIITGNFNCKGNKNLKNKKDIINQIIKNQMEAFRYETDYGTIYFKDIKEEFEIFRKKIKQNKLMNNVDYGLSI